MIANLFIHKEVAFYQKKKYNINLMNFYFLMHLSGTG